MPCLIGKCVRVLVMAAMPTLFSGGIKVVNGFVQASLLRRTIAVLDQSKNQNYNGEALTATSSSLLMSMQSSSRTGIAQPTVDTTSLGTLEVPSVGIGTIAWSSEKFLQLENTELQSVVKTACESNAAFFDTAERYGSNYKTAFGMGWGETESLTSILLRRQLASDNAGGEGTNDSIPPVVATKFTPSPWRTTARSVVEACEQSRARLGVDQIDLYQLHMPDIVQPFRIFGKAKVKDEMYWDGLAECYHRGLVKNVGVCNYGPTLMRQCQEALAKRDVPLASNQISYSLVGRHNGAQETLGLCNELGIRVLASFPLAMGLLTGKYSSTDKGDNISLVKGTDMHSLSKNKKTTLEQFELNRYALGDGAVIPAGGISPVLSVMEGIAKERNKTVAQVALNYIMCKGAIPIPGSRTAAQVQDNIGAMGWRLSDEEVLALEASADSLGFGFDGAGFKRTSEKFVGYGIEKWRLD